MMGRRVIELAQRGDHEAFESLASCTIDRLYGAAFLTLHDRALAEDATQETLIRAWRDLQGLRDPDRFEAWLHRVLMHACMDVARRERGHRQDHDVPEWALVLHEAEEDVVNRDAVARGMARISARERAVLVLRFYLGLSVPKMAEALRVPVGTAKSRLHHAERALRAAIDADTRLTLQGGLA